MFTGRRVTQVNCYDVNPDKTGEPGDEVWEMEQSIDIDTAVELFIGNRLGIITETSIGCLYDFATYLKTR